MQLSVMGRFCRAAVALLAIQQTQAYSKEHDRDSYFTAYEDLAHSVVEYIPLVGTLYSLARGAIAAVEHNQKHYWASVADAIEGSIRDVVLVAKFAEPVPVTLVHVMAESFTEKLIEIYHSKPKVPEVGINYMLSRNTTYIIISEARTQEKAAAFFKGMAKGVFYFYGANFVGTLWETNYAWAGEQIRLEFTRGVYDGAPVFLSWTWTRDSNGIAHRPEVVYGRLVLYGGTIPHFDVKNRGGAGGWQGYEFWGEINSLRSVTVYIIIGRRTVRVDLRRVDGT